MHKVYCIPVLTRKVGGAEHMYQRCSASQQEDSAPKNIRQIETKSSEWETKKKEVNRNYETWKKKRTKGKM